MGIECSNFVNLYHNVEYAIQLYELQSILIKYLPTYLPTDITAHALLSTYAVVLYLVFVIRTYALFLDIFINKSHLYKLQLVGIECSIEKRADNCLF